MKLKILKYNRDKAIGKFIYFKLLELFGLFLFIFGFETLGRFMYTKYDWLTMPTPLTYMEFWLYGFISFFCILFILFAAVIIAYATIYILIHWVKLNWWLAKKSSEDEESKIERLSEQKKLKKIRRIEKLERVRKKHGYCKGDTAIVTQGGFYGVVGRKFEIRYVNSTGSLDIKDKTEKYECVPRRRFKIVKNKLPKKPKLNKIREKEVNDRKKKK